MPFTTFRRRTLRRLYAGLAVLSCLALLGALAAFGAEAPAHAAEARADRAPAPARAQASATPEQQLADRYAPIVYLREVNADICDTENEGFDPVGVDFVLGRPDIPLMDTVSGLPTGPRRLITESPVASDLYGLSQPFYLDYPGTPLRPGCVYRRYFAGRIASEDVPRVAYAHVYQEPGTDELALQYWMYYYFNDWNNNHEGDWEMIMLFFDADTVEEALAQEPTRVVYAQHGGGERADWDDDKLRTEEGRPVVYVARGAHASFYEPYTYLGLVENGTGLGCETAKGPHRRFALEPIVVPHEPSGPNDPFAWLAFTGRWGEFRRSEWNGPTGPNDKTSWTQPVTWTERQRDSSLIVPEFSGFGQGPVDVLCGAVSFGSRALVAFTQAPTIGMLILGSAVAAIGWALASTSGTIRRAWGYYRRHLRVFLPLGAMLIPTGLVVATLQTLLFEVPPIEPLVGMLDAFPGVRVLLLLAIGGAGAALAVIFVAPATIWTMGELRRGRLPSVFEAYREGLHAIWPIFRARLRVTVRAVLRALTIVGIPRAVLMLIRAHYIPQTVVLLGDDADASIRDSAVVANAGLRRTLLTQIVLGVITLLSGPLIAILVLIVLPSRPLSLINYISSLLFAALYPFSVIGMTLLYEELRAGERPQPATGQLEAAPAG